MYFISIVLLSWMTIDHWIKDQTHTTQPMDHLKKTLSKLMKVNTKDNYCNIAQGRDKI
jgi:hypothetical protein